ncbi:uncharacterized protein SPPG_07823 [Spizellomyces punctatus DAOM BR117]|uniref:Thiamine-binding protein domain-containing protein n=1 Tax=Spizellomyces punctatus (strain DAOM BR117) TaxID=645134 RepID=A0A0L0H6Z3_SPIPD|nr:uncharacterized protein SPPG_07823 [Spizellomyces punctatus DAOM BR117]KNC97007.1 hypothetical protein SPPG_07823 [Spizellomyces punctatus DAOM BR117]|eukprot:XP_016605047.1 hypothetical protein SPPG_07823 [Spizellomyces punctatus DAOM BR117]
MKVVADFCLIPLGVGTSLTKYVAIVQQTLQASPHIKYLMHSCGTNIEGEWDHVMEAIKSCHTSLHTRHAVPRIHTTVRIGTRIDKDSSIQEKIDRVKSELESSSSSS